MKKGKCTEGLMHEGKHFKNRTRRSPAPGHAQEFFRYKKRK
ncbi:hypothetical protein QUW58_23405 [Enterocloster aldenensis]|nr:hypothetical protein [uncultured Lachnoclostridium sp.]MDM8298144.1 hypothetical protein [Enterocloster aldenensis]